MVEIRNILAAVDFDDTANKVLSYGQSMAEKFGAKLWIVHVAAPDPDFVGYAPGPQYIRDTQADELRGDHKKLQDLCDRFIGTSVEAEALLIQGSTVETLLEEVNKLEVDLLIVGTHRHSLLYNIFSESVSSKLFDRVSVPLLAVPINEE